VVGVGGTTVSNIALGVVVLLAVGLFFLIEGLLLSVQLAEDSPHPPLKIALLGTSAQVLKVAFFAFLALVSLARREWWGLLFLAPALLYGGIVFVRLRRMYR
jgi:hypothetical protein